MSSYTVSGTDTVTITNAKYLSSKVATDLKRFQRYYGSPSDQWIDNYEAELTALLKFRAVDSVVYGFKRNGLWTLAAVKYVALSDGTLQVDDDPGRIRPNLDITGASFTSFLSYSASWFRRPAIDRQNIEQTLPFSRSTGEAPALERGYWEQDRSYASGSLGLGRSSVRT